MFRHVLAAASASLAACLPVAQAAGTPALSAVQGHETNTDAAFRAVLDRYVALTEADAVTPAAAAQLRGDLSAMADRGDGEALNLLAILTEEGIAQPPNPQAAMALFRLGAEAGSVSAALNLAIRQIQSSDAAIMAEGAARFDALAARTDLPEPIAATVIGYRGWTLALGLREPASPDENARDMIAAGLAANPDEPSLHWAMATLIEVDGPNPADRARVLDHYRQAGLNGHGRAAWRAGMMYLNGDGTEPDPVEGFRWVNLAAAAGLDDGLISLAVMYAVGQGTEPNLATARELYGEAARRGNAHALRGLGLMLIFGEGGEPDPVAGIALVRLAAEAGDVVAAELLVDLAPQLPDEPDWVTAVAAARQGFLHETGLSPDSLYGAQTQPPAAPAIISNPD